MKAVRTRSSVVESVSTIPTLHTARHVNHRAPMSSTTGQRDEREYARDGLIQLRARPGHGAMAIRAHLSPTASSSASGSSSASQMAGKAVSYHWLHAWRKRTGADRDIPQYGDEQMEQERGELARIDICLSARPSASRSIIDTPPLQRSHSPHRRLPPTSQSSPRASIRSITTSTHHHAQVATKQSYDDDAYSPSYLPFHPPAPPSQHASSSPSSSRAPPAGLPGTSSRKMANASAFADEFDFRASFSDEPGDAGQDDLGWYGDNDSHVFDYIHKAGVPEMPRDVMERAMRKLKLWESGTGVGHDEAHGEGALDALTREDVLAMGAKVVRPRPGEEQRRTYEEEEYEEERTDKAEAKTKTGRRAKLPPLPLPLEIKDDQARYDWRTIAPSRAGRKKAKKWYPEMHHERTKTLPRREHARQTHPAALDEEAERYVDHFTLLLEAELAEIRMQHAYRLTEWTEKRLKAEGYMLDCMVATPHIPYRNSEKPQWVYQFRREGFGMASKLDTNNHKVKQGACLEISRLHPQIDHINKQGEAVTIVEDPEVVAKYLREKDGHGYELPAYDPEDRLFGTVLYENAQYIRVAFPVQIPTITMGEWRLDIAHNDFIIKRQIEKLQSLFLDPIMQEIRDAKKHGVKPIEVPSIKGDHTAQPKAGPGALARGPGKRYRLVLPEQTIFDGTALRDLLLRGFQQTYIPYAAGGIDDKLDDSHIESVEVYEAAVPASAGSSAPDDSNAASADDESGEISGALQKVRGRQSILMRHPRLNDWVTRHRHGGKVEKVKDDPELTLNESQIKAIAMMLGERLSLVQGPPGTGKTRTIIEAIKLLKLHWKIPHPTLVTAHTNAAVDNLAAGLHEHGLKVVRIGAADRIRPDVASQSLEMLMEKHPKYADVDKLRKEATSLGMTISECQKRIDQWRRNDGSGPYSSPDDVEQAKEDRSKAYERVNTVKDSIKVALAIIRKEILVDADVVCSTCLSSVKADLDCIDFPIVFLDEASMATEPLSWLPLSKGSMHVSIIGDHKQLPPVITSPAAHIGGLSTSMFERLIREGDIPSIMLDTQYRMHPQISAFPNEAFYAGALHDGSVDKHGQPHADLLPPDAFWLKEDANGNKLNFTFVDTDAPESPRNLSIANETEADLVCDVVSDLLAENPDIRGADIGVITPYIAQINLLEQYLGPADEIRTKQFENYLGEERAKDLADIEIKTVDGFEGREKDVIIFSTVRSNDKGYIGFLADWRRLNVGLTRAKRGLIMIGSAKTLSKARIGLQAQEVLPQGGAEVWRKLMRHIKEKDLLLQVDQPVDD